jgi:hypothetical protein
MAERRMCYWLPYVPNGAELGADPSHYFPGIVFADEGNYYVTDWDYGADRELAARCVDELNQKLGVNKDEALQIVVDSMSLGRRGIR